MVPANTGNEAYTSTNAASTTFVEGADHSRRSTRTTDFSRLDESSVSRGSLTSISNSASRRNKSKIFSKIDHSQMPPIHSIPLWMLNCQFDMVKKRHTKPIPLHQAVASQRKTQRANVTVVFAIRQAGWVSCREHGQQLTELAARDPKMALLAIVKGDGGNDPGILEFYTDFFERRPIYMDEKWDIFRAMGGKTIGAFKLLTRLIAAQSRYLKKKLTNHSGNARPKAIHSNWMLGGVLVFNRRGDLTFALEEKVGTPLDMQRLEAAIVEARRPSTIHGSRDSRSHDSSSLMDSSEMTIPPMQKHI